MPHWILTGAVDREPVCPGHHQASRWHRTVSGTTLSIDHGFTLWKSGHGFCGNCYQHPTICLDFQIYPKDEDTVDTLHARNVIESLGEQVMCTMYSTSTSTVIDQIYQHLPVCKSNWTRVHRLYNKVICLLISQKTPVAQPWICKRNWLLVQSEVNVVLLGLIKQ